MPESSFAAIHGPIAHSGKRRYRLRWRAYVARDGAWHAMGRDDSCEAPAESVLDAATNFAVANASGPVGIWRALLAIEDITPAPELGPRCDVCGDANAGVPQSDRRCARLGCPGSIG